MILFFNKEKISDSEKKRKEKKRKERNQSKQPEKDITVEHIL